MKTITIPTNYDPFRVTVNGKEYVYQGGATVSVPDDVADVIENMIQPEYEPHSDFVTEADMKAYISGEGFEETSNKVTSISATPSDTKYPSEKAVSDAITAALIVDTDDEVE